MEKSEYNSLAEWRKANDKGYQAAVRNCCLDEICDNFGWRKPKKPKNYWTFERCIKEALKFTSKNEWRENNRSSHSAADNNGWMDECCKHMKLNITKRKPPGYWTKEKCIEEAKKHKRKQDWKKNSYASYSRASKNEWVAECCVHMEQIQRKEIVY